MTATAVVRARIDEATKNEATAVLDELGLTVSDVVRMTLKLVARDKALPFELKIPNAETRAAMEEARLIVKSKKAPRLKTAQELFDALDKKAGL